VQLLVDIERIFRERQVDRLHSQDVTDELVKMEDRRWPEWGRQKKPITPTAMAQLLKPFGIKPADIRIGETVKRGYRVEWFEEAFSRYLPPLQGATVLHPNSHADSEASQSATRENDVAPANRSEPAPAKECSGVALRQGEGGLTREEYIEKLDLVDEDREIYDPGSRESRVRALGGDWA
jgi:hypothetical protein